MKLQHLPPQIQDTILMGAIRVLGESADMAHMLQKADTLLKHEFPDVKPSGFAEDIADLEERLALAKWIKEFTERFEGFFVNIKYPKKYWRNTIGSEMSSWVSGDAWKETTPTDAVNSNISYWEK